MASRLTTRSGEQPEDCSRRIPRPRTDRRGKKCSNSSSIDPKDQVAVGKHNNSSREKRLTVFYANVRSGRNKCPELIVAAAKHKASIFANAERWLIKQTIFEEQLEGASTLIIRTGASGVYGTEWPSALESGSTMLNPGSNYPLGTSKYVNSCY